MIRFFPSLFRGSQTAAHGPWTCFTLSRLSPDKRESYSFRVNISENGEMILCGYCNDGEDEHSSEDGVTLSPQAVDMLSRIEIEKLVAYAPKRKSRRAKPASGAERIAQVTYVDGSELAVSLSYEQWAAIVSLLEVELITAVNADKHGEWSELWLNFKNDNYSEWYDFEVSRNDSGEWIAKGYCSDRDCIRYESEDGISISQETLETLRGMHLERYLEIRKSKFDPIDQDEVWLDAPSGGLTLIYADGYTAKKSIPEKVENSIFLLLRKEFALKAYKQ